MRLDQGGQRLRVEVVTSWVAVLAVSLASVALAGAATATVTKDYVLTPDSKLITPISSAEDFITDTLHVPTWLDGAAATPVVDYMGDTPQITENIIRVEFTDDGSGNIIDGPITITRMDFFHNIDSTLADLVIITGVNDATTSGATGTMVGGVVTGWSPNLVGLIHNELYCEDVGGNTLCGTNDLPANMTTMVVHDAAAALVIDTLAVPNAASLPMTFNVDYSALTMEMTIDDSGLGRQYYDISATEALPEVPLSDTPVQLLIIALMGLVGLFALNRDKIVRFASGGKAAR
jgi:hypothetical protein